MELVCLLPQLEQEIYTRQHEKECAGNTEYEVGMAQMRPGRNRKRVEEALPVDGKALEPVNLWGRSERSDDLTRSSGPRP